ncbi:cytochrome P450 [Lepidopterella palustris CBS 459.81]|uniref:Cytochrome P450 n=1 Tax=Lepidopterella palustris CBS 459.81 TaxID=1314670 RepID=A0A8E2ELQ2_9PEZI|nr:cytochrome P450 [Lepidopterella palustris CBS 459.81]
MAGAFINSLVAAAGAATHLGYFTRGEHHLYGAKYIQAFLATCIVGVIAVVRISGAPAGTAIIKTISLASCYLGGLYASLITYRVFFHPLRNFPGPLGNKIANIYFSAQLGNADAYKKVAKLHEKYGDFVRIGSSDLSIIHSKGVSIVYGPGTKCLRAAVYNGDPLPSLIAARDRSEHDKMRRNWSSAFSEKALRGYEQRIKIYEDQLAAAVSSGKPINVSKCFNYYSFDVMGDLAYGKSFDMLKKNEEHWAIKLVNEGMEPMAFLFPAWLFRILIAIPGLAKDYWRLVAFCASQTEARITTTVDVPDIMSSLLERFKGERPTGHDLLVLQGDSRVIIVAGSDTTAATLTYTFYHLAQDPVKQAKLRAEIAPHIEPSGKIVHKNIQNLDYLNGFINEVLRLHPPVPTALARLTPPEGVQIGDTHIPGNTTLWCPQYAIGRDENIYTDAKEFVPERWYSKPEMVKEKSAFAPFSAGIYYCLGKPLALMEIRTVIARLLMSYNVSFAPGEDGSNLLEKTRDHFSLGLADLNLVFTER